MRKITLFIIFMSLHVFLLAQTARWSILPQYDAITPLSASIVMVQQGGHFGLMDVSGKEIIPCKYDRIGGFSDGRCVVLSEGVLAAIVDEGGEVITAGEKQQFFVDPEYPFFSEGLLAVSTSSGYGGYLDISGQAVQFPFPMTNVRPFVNGYAVVRYKDETYVHVARSGAINKLNSEFKNNRLSFASSFTQIGGKLLSVVVDDSGKAFLRNIMGGKEADLGKLLSYEKQARKMTTDGYQITFSPDFQINTAMRTKGRNKGEETFNNSWSYPSYTPDSFFGFRSERGDNNLYNVIFGDREILVAQFDETKPIGNRHIVVSKSGHTGLVQVNSGLPFALKLESNYWLARHLDAVEVHGTIEPRESAGSDYRITIHCGENLIYQGTAPRGNVSFRFTPASLDGQESKIVSTVEVDGLVYPPKEDNLAFTFKSGFSVRVSPGKVQCERGENSATVSIIIKNIADVASGSCSISIDGRMLRRDVILDAGEEIKIPYACTVDFKDQSSVTRPIVVRIKEVGCPEIKDTRSVVFERKSIATIHM